MNNATIIDDIQSLRKMLYTNFDSTKIQKTYQHLVKSIVEYYKLK